MSLEMFQHNIEMIKFLTTFPQLSLTFNCHYNRFNVQGNLCLIVIKSHVHVYKYMPAQTKNNMGLNLINPYLT